MGGVRKRSYLLTLVLVIVVPLASGCADTGSDTGSAPGGGRPTTTMQPVTTSPPTPGPTTTAPTTTSPPTAPTSTTVPPPAGIPAGNPWPAIGPIAPGHHAVLVMGDSIAGQMLWSLPDVLASMQIDAVTYDATMPTAGLLDDLYGQSPPDFFAAQLAAHPDVDTVVFEFAGACRTCGPEGVVYGSPDFFARWQAVAHQLMADAKARGLHVLWAISPPPPQPDDPNDLHFIVAAQVAGMLVAYDRTYPKTDGVTSADWFTALADISGLWQPALWYDGALHDVRVADLVHLTPDGSVRTSTWTVAALSKAWAA
jgi:hypothetical protein